MYKATFLSKILKAEKKEISITLVVRIKDENTSFVKLFSGKSKCSPKDTYSESFGKHIAESRAKIKLYKYMYKYCLNNIKHYWYMIFGNYEVFLNTTKNGSLMGDYNKYKFLYQREIEHLNKLLNESVCTGN